MASRGGATGPARRTSLTAKEKEKTGRTTGTTGGGRPKETPPRLRELGEDDDGKDFSGFDVERGNSTKVDDLERQFENMRVVMNEVLERQENLMKGYNEMKEKCADYDRLLKENDSLKRSMEALNRENAELKEKASQQEISMKKVEEQVKNSSDEVKRMEDSHNEWKNIRKVESVEFKNIVNQQIDERAKAQFIRGIKENENLVRDTVERKRCVVVFGLKESEILNRIEREKVEKESLTKVLEKVKDEDSRLENEVEEFRRLGKYVKDKSRPLKIKFKSQIDAEEALAGSHRLAQVEETKNIWIKKDLNREERQQIKELWNEAKAKNEERTEEEEVEFYWKVIDMKLRKWYTKTRAEASQN